MRLQVCASAFGVSYAIIGAPFVLLACNAGQSEHVTTSLAGAPAEGGKDSASQLGPEASAEEPDGSADSLSDGSLDDSADGELPFDLCPDGGCGDAPGPGCGPGQSLYFTLPGCSVGPVCQSQTQGACTQAFCGCDGVAFIDRCGAPVRPFQVYSACVNPDGGCPNGSCLVQDPSDASVCVRPGDWVKPLSVCIGDGGSN
jgi:hypothetical protein